MYQLLLNGQWALFALILISLVISLTFHEFGHAATARWFGDDTAQRAGRLTLNPLAHLDAFGTLMVVMVGFGYAKPVPTNPANFRSRWADLFVSAAGPGMNLALAFVTVNVYLLGLNLGWESFRGEGARFFFVYLAQINLLLMVFNLLPIGALDGHHMLPYFLSRKWGYYYRFYNDRYGNMALMALVLLSFAGVPVFRVIWSVGSAILPAIAIF